MLNKHEIVYNFKQSDITNQDVVNEKISALKPEVIYHCAAYTAVDNAEDVAKDLNWQVNADGTRNVAEAAKRVGAKMVYISTDYVFDGANEGEYEVDAPTNPRNEYGKAKLAGEKAIQEILADYYIIRTSWVFGKYGKNFVYSLTFKSSAELCTYFIKKSDIQSVIQEMIHFDNLSPYCNAFFKNFFFKFFHINLYCCSVAIYLL